ncbi:MAG: 4Fe-4S binding protein, partial [Spirochaetales bacterium]|nr:4Fe-4S binding protein [Spirochaetales bacterium]
PERSSLWVFLGIIGLALFLGPAFCGWLCPLGTVQEWLGRLGRRILGRRYNRLIPARLDRALGYLRYAVLAGAVAAGAAALVTDAVNPSLALVHVWSAAVPVTAVALLAVVLAASLVVERPWCRWLCPLGALQGLVALLSPWTIRRNAAACTLCRRCDRACPMGIAVSKGHAVRSDRCNRCTACVEACPQEGALTYSARPGRLRLRRAAAAAAVLVVFSLPLAVAGALGWYLPEGRSPGLMVGSAGGAEAGVAAARDGVPERRPFDPSTLSPRMTLAETAARLGVEPGYLLEIIGLEARFDLSTALFDIEEHPDYEEVTFGYVRSVLEAHFGSKDS